MVTEKQNPPNSDNNGEEDAKPLSFSIRQYVLANRQKDISSNWPFPEKYLHICQKHGISDVLPPFEPHDSKGVGLSGSQEEKENGVSFGNKVKNECGLYLDEAISGVNTEDSTRSLLDNSCKDGENDNLSPNVASNVIVPINQPSTAISISHLHIDQRTETMASPKKMASAKKFRHKRKKRKGKCKKRSMVDILAVAKHCTLEDIYRIGRLSCRSVKPSEDRVEGSEIMANVEQNCKSELTEENLEKKFQKDGGEAANDNPLGKKGRLLKIKFGGCISQSWNIN